MPHRYFTNELAAGRAALTGSDAHHLADVMRAKLGEEVVLCGPDGLEYLGTVTAIQSGRVEFTVTKGTTSKAEPDVAVTLFAGYPKQGKLEEVIRHSVELGVTEIVPFFSRYCVATPKKENAKNERYNRIAAEAAKQAGRAMLPHVSMPLLNFAAVCDALQEDYDLALFFYEGGGAAARLCQENCHRHGQRGRLLGRRSRGRQGRRGCHGGLRPPHPAVRDRSPHRPDRRHAADRQPGISGTPYYSSAAARVKQRRTLWTRKSCTPF